MSAADLVYVPRLYSDQRPIYHERGRYTERLQNGAKGDELYTRCGIPVYRFVLGDIAPRLDRPRLRRDHAETIGAACERCRHGLRADARWQAKAR